MARITAHLLQPPRAGQWKQLLPAATTMHLYPTGLDPLLTVISEDDDAEMEYRFRWITDRLPFDSQEWAYLGTFTYVGQFTFYHLLVERKATAS